MATYTTSLITGPIQDGILLSKNTAAFSQLTLGTVVHTHLAFVSPSDNAMVMAINTTTTISALASGNMTTVEAVSDIKVRLVSPSTPHTNDILVLINGVKAGIYQYNTNTWIYRGETTASALTSSSVSTGLSTGFITNQSFTGLTAQVVKVDTLPDELLPYKVYADRITGIIYFPYINASSYQFPYAVASMHSPQLVSQLLEEQVVVISPCGYNQTSTLPNNTSYIFFTYSSLASPSVRQPVSVYSSALAPLVYLNIMPTTLTIDYSMVSGIQDTAYQLASGYYRGGNNLWDIIVSDYGQMNSKNIRQITPTSIYPTAIVDLMLCQISSNVPSSKIFVYIGKETNIQSSDIMFTLDMAPLSTNRLSNIRLASGEAIFCSTSPAINYTYRYTILARSF